MGGFAAYQRNFKDDVIPPQKLSKSKNQKYTFDPFDAPPHYSKNLGNGAATGATGDINTMRTNRGIYEWHVLGAGQTILVPVYDLATGLGLDFGQDQTSTEGHQVRFTPNIVTPPAVPRGKHAYKIGTDKAFFARLKILLTDASGVNPFCFGFFKAQAYQTALDSYSDFAVIRLVPSTTFASIRQRWNLNGGTAAEVDSTQTTSDNAAITMEVRVKQDGKVSFVVNGAYPTVAKTDFVFDSGDVVYPGTFFLHGTDVADNVYYQEFESGFLPERAV
jgi:hypothetical protein